jgi:hypothetical protein
MSAAPSTTAPPAARTNGARSHRTPDPKARQRAEQTRQELLALIGVDNLATFQIVDNGNRRALLDTEVVRMQTPVTDGVSIKPLTWLLPLVRQEVTPVEPAPAKVYAPGWSPTEVEALRAQFAEQYKDVLNAKTRYVDGDNTPELGPELLALLTTKVTSDKGLGYIKWLLTRTEKWLRRQSGKQAGGSRVAYSSG